MTGAVIPITTNNFTRQDSGKYTIDFPVSSLPTFVGTTEAGPIRCYRDDGTTSRQVLFYHEIDASGNIRFYFDEPFGGKIVLSSNT